MTGYPAVFHSAFCSEVTRRAFCKHASCSLCHFLWLLTDVVIMPHLLISAAASSFSFCRPAVEYRALPEDFKQQLSRRTGGNLTWHDGRGQKSAGGRTVKLLQQPGTEALQVNLTVYMWKHMGNKNMLISANQISGNIKIWSLACWVICLEVILCFWLVSNYAPVVLSSYIYARGMNSLSDRLVVEWQEQSFFFCSDKLRLICTVRTYEK